MQSICVSLDSMNDYACIFWRKYFYPERRNVLVPAVEMSWVSEKVGLIKTVAEIAFDRFDRATKGLSESEIDWRPMERPTP